MTALPFRFHLSLCLFGAALIAAALCPPPAAAQGQTSDTCPSAPATRSAAPGKSAPARKPKADPAPRSDSLIEIRFADPAIPDIHATGVATPLEYGIHYSAEELRARDAAALAAPPPDLGAYEISWQSHEEFDLERLRQTFEAGRSYTGYGWSNNGWSDYGVYVYPFTTATPDLAPWALGGPVHLTPADAYPRYNLLEYNAALADWRRARERAALRAGMASGTSVTQEDPPEP